MPFRYPKVIFAATLALLLAACGPETEKKSAKTLYLEGFQQLSNARAQYNFDADITLDGSEFGAVLADAKINIKGAVDLAKQRYELVPELQTGIFQVKLPLNLDLDKQSILLDPVDILNVAQMFLPEAASLTQRYQGKHIRLQKADLQLDAEEQEKIDQAFAIAGELASITFAVTDEVSQGLAESNFAIHELNMDNKAAAKKAVTLTLSAEQRKQLEHTMQQLFRQKVEQSQQISAAVKEEIFAALEESANDETLESNASIVYLNDANEIIRINERYTYGVEGKQVVLDMDVTLSNHGQAEFSTLPLSGQIIDLDAAELSAIQKLVGK